jgi:xanthine dehydrogenase accessory factor
VLAIVIRTAGSTYAKPGSLMLIAEHGEYAGLLSGGCLEGDLAEHAQRVRETGLAHIVSYDMRTDDDRLFGLGSGCEGAMEILLVRVGPAEKWQPLDHLLSHFEAGAGTRLAVVTRSTRAGIAAGTSYVDAAAIPADPGFQVLRNAFAAAGDETPPQTLTLRDGSVDCLLVAIPAPTQLLIAGAGPDTRPVAELARFLGWHVTLVDHRPAYADAALFAAGCNVVLARPEALASTLELQRFSAAVVMSHHLDSDLAYLQVLATTDIPYVGLLGPAQRRAKLLADLGTRAKHLESRLRAPIGLDIGGRSPESIALSIVSEIHAVLHGRAGEAFALSAGAALEPAAASRHAQPLP